LKLVGVGVALGLLGALAVSRFLQTQLFGITAHDPRTFITVALLLFAAAIAGCLVPARRATRIDPMTALRAE
jgi:ABC-type antimicrobial peptide transport system permease subunit